MGDKTTALIAAAITLPLAFLLVWLSIRNLFDRLKDVRDAVRREREKRIDG